MFDLFSSILQFLLYVDKTIKVDIDIDYSKTSPVLISNF